MGVFGTSKMKLFGGSEKIKKAYLGTEKIYSAGNIVTYYVDNGVSYQEEIDSDASCLNPITFTPSKSGWTFVGWREDTTASADVLRDKVMGDKPITLYAVFKKTCTLTAKSHNAQQIVKGTAYYNGAGNITNATCTIPAGASYPGWTWRGWSQATVGDILEGDGNFEDINYKITTNTDWRWHLNKYRGVATVVDDENKMSPAKGKYLQIVASGQDVDNDNHPDQPVLKRKHHLCVEGGTTYTLDMYIRRNSEHYPYVVLYDKKENGTDTAVATIRTEHSSSVSEPDEKGWQHIKHVFTTHADATMLQMYIYGGGNAADLAFDIDGITIVKASEVHNTLANAGVGYKNGDTINLGVYDATIYGLYYKTIYLYYNGNGSTSGSVSTQSGTRYYNCYGTTINPSFALASNGYSRNDYTFTGWNLGAVGATVTLSSSSTAYAQWSLNTNKYVFSNGSLSAGVSVSGASVSGGKISAGVASAAGTEGDKIIDSEVAELIVTISDIDLTNYSKLYISTTSELYNHYGEAYCNVGIDNENTRFFTVNSGTGTGVWFTDTIILDVSSYTGTHSLKFYLYAYSHSSYSGYHSVCRLGITEIRLHN